MIYMSIARTSKWKVDATQFRPINGNWATVNKMVNGHRYAEF